MKEEKGTTRRGFLKVAAGAGAGLGLAGTSLVAAEDEKSGKPAASVPQRPLGNTGADIPILVLGCAQKFDPKYDKILHRALKEGVNYLDTALVYADGQSHLTIAPFIKQVGREKLWITSKGPSKDADVASYTANLDTCLEQLETDYLDMYFMHFIDDPKFLEPEYLKMGDAMRASKKTKFFGFSCHGDRQVEVLEKAAKVGGIDAIMFRYSFSRYGDLELNKAIDNCKEAGIGLIAMKTQESVPDDQTSVVGFASKDFTLHQAKLKAVWADERIDAAVSHMDNTKKLAENIAAAKSPVQLAMGDFQQLQRIATATAGYACHGCSHICESQFEGAVRIAAPLRYLMYHECYGESERAKTLFDRLSPEEKNFASVDFTRAMAKCPQGINIAARLREVERHLA